MRPPPVAPGPTRGSRTRDLAEAIAPDMLAVPRLSHPTPPTRQGFTEAFAPGRISGAEAFAPDTALPRLAHPGLPRLSHPAQPIPELNHPGATPPGLPSRAGAQAARLLIITLGQGALGL